MSREKLIVDFTTHGVLLTQATQLIGLGGLMHHTSFSGVDEFFHESVRVFVAWNIEQNH